MSPPASKKRCSKDGTNEHASSTKSVLAPTPVEPIRKRKQHTTVPSAKRDTMFCFTMASHDTDGDNTQCMDGSTRDADLITVAGEASFLSTRHNQSHHQQQQQQQQQFSSSVATVRGNSHQSSFSVAMDPWNSSALIPTFRPPPSGYHSAIAFNNEVNRSIDTFLQQQSSTLEAAQTLQSPSVANVQQRTDEEASRQDREINNVKEASRSQEAKSS
eukprot:scaffold1593_cov193-Alexandrium_tamarense.AAC.85